MFLNALAAMSVLSVSSKHSMYNSTNTIIVNMSRVLSRHLPSPSQYCLSKQQGTRVCVRNLFGNMPVRVKQRDMEVMALQSHSKA